MSRAIKVYTQCVDGGHRMALHPIPRTAIAFTTNPRKFDCRVVWRLQRFCRCRLCRRDDVWMYSCRTPALLRDRDFRAGMKVGDGSDKAALDWLLEAERLAPRRRRGGR